MSLFIKEQQKIVNDRFSHKVAEFLLLLSPEFTKVKVKLTSDMEEHFASHVFLINSMSSCAVFQFVRFPG